MTVRKGDSPFPLAALEPAMSDEPTTAELARQLAALEGRHREERAEYRQEMRTGFDEVKKMIAGIATIAPEVFVSDQSRQDAELDTVKAEVVWLRRTIIFGVLALIGGQIIQGLVA